MPQPLENFTFGICHPFQGAETFQMGSREKPLELTVIPLSVPDDDLAAYILSNVNRWRGQVGIADLSAGELADHSKVIDLDGYSATLVNVGGTAAAAAGRNHSGIAGQQHPRHR